MGLLSGNDKAVTTARVGVARLGITRLGAVFRPVETVQSGAKGGHYIWRERKQNTASVWTKRRP